MKELKFPQQQEFSKKKIAKIAKIAKRAKPKRRQDNISTKTLDEKLKNIEGHIHKAAVKSGRTPQNITLVAITKEFPIEIWEKAINANITTLGESRIQEAQKKSEIFSKRKQIELHFIGHLQTNKARKAIELFDVIQTVDSIKLADRINTICKTIEKKQTIFIQVNMGEDPTKHGIPINRVSITVRKIMQMENIKLAGIMTIPPNGLSPKEISLIYRNTRKIRDEIRSTINDQCQNISMGMSNDYEIAIAEGATHIRIGTALFGARPN